MGMIVVSTASLNPDPGDSMVAVEYLFVVQKADTFCDSDDAFNRFLRVDSAIAIDGGKIRHRGDFECDYQLTSGEIPSKQQRFFHLQFSADEKVSLERFSEFLKAIRSLLSKVGAEAETLRDDISFIYARRGYEFIHRIETLMRKLIANFMLVTIGKEWVNEASPDEVKDAIAKSKRKNASASNVLYTVDFSHLADLLLKPYSNKQTAEIFRQVKTATTLSDLEAVKQVLPESNWTRYFKKLVDCEDEYLKKRWDELYDLRCKIAHNAIVTKSDIDRIEELVGELQPKLDEATKKLPQLKVPAADIEHIAENAANAISSQLGQFIRIWRRLESATLSLAEKHGLERGNRPFRRTLTFLREKRALSPVMLQRLAMLQDARNHYIHSDGSDIDEEMLASVIASAAAITNMITRIISEPPPSDQQDDAEA